jgi:hypothetical protein
MLRSENRGQPDIISSGKTIDDVGEAVIDRRVITDDADAGATKAPGRQQEIGPETDHRVIRQRQLSEPDHKGPTLDRAAGNHTP